MPNSFMQDKRKAVLFCREDPVCELLFDLTTKSIAEVSQIHRRDLLPLGVIPFGQNALSRTRFNEWWKYRSIPLDRGNGSARLDCREQLIRSMAFGLSDQYWIRDVNSNATWAQYNFFDNGFSDEMGRYLYSQASGHPSEKPSDDTHVPDLATGGQLNKRWTHINGAPALIKGGSVYNQQPYNEVFASYIYNELQTVPYAPYFFTPSELEIDSRSTSYSFCFVNRDTELVTAAQITECQKRSNQVSPYQHYLDCCQTLCNQNIRPYVDVMFLIDFIICNTDRHLNNFGLIHDLEKNTYTIAPVFDNGTSLWCKEHELDISVLGHTIEAKPFVKTQPKILELISDLSLFDFSSLKNIDEVANDIFLKEPRISEKRRDILVNGVSARMEMAKRFCLEKIRTGKVFYGKCFPFHDMTTNAEVRFHEQQPTHKINTNEHSTKKDGPGGR